MPNLQSQRELPLGLVNQKRAVKLELTKQQISLLAEYAIRNGYQRKYPNSLVAMDITEENIAAKYAIMHRLGLN